MHGPNCECPYCDSTHIVTGNVKPPAASAGYRLLEDGDIIQIGDEFIDDDAVTWISVGRDRSVAGMWMIGMTYSTRGIFKPMRRKR